jgi:hypothetical protein
VVFSYFLPMAEHASPEQLQQLLAAYAKKIPVGSRRYHRKKEEVTYLIVDLVVDEATEQVAVVYEQQSSGLRFVRSADSFLEQIEKPE